MALYIISQVLMFIGMAIDLASRIMKNKKYILIFMTAGSIFYVSSYLCQNAPLPAIANACSLVRGISYLYIEKKNAPFKFYLIPMAVIFTGFAISIGFLWRDNMDIIMIASILILTICLAFKNLLVVRVGLLANSAIWIAYNYYIASYVGIACNVLNILIIIGAIITYNFILPRKEAKLKKEQSLIKENEINLANNTTVEDTGAAKIEPTTDNRTDNNIVDKYKEGTD